MYTGVIGLLEDGLLGSGVSLAEARVLYELRVGDAQEVTELRRRLGLDPGYASRLLAGLAKRGLISRERSATDGRRQLVALTEAGKVEQNRLEERTVEQIGVLLSPLGDDDQERLLAAMRTVRRFLGGHGEAALVLRPPRAGDLGWVVERHGALYAQEFGWGPDFEALVASVAAEYLRGIGNPKQGGWIAELDGERVGSVLCMPSGHDGVAKLRLLLLEPSARGRGVGTRLVAECVAFAKASGYVAVELWTNDVLTAAREIYRRAGFGLVARKPHHSFGKDLVGETWRLDF